MNVKDITQKQQENFWAKVDKRGACWLWTASKSSRNGYGMFRLGKKLHPSHRISYALHNQKWPELFVLHECDNPSCVNYEHLHEGTAKQNSAEARERNRINYDLIRGERNGRSTISDATVEAIRNDYSRDERNGYKLAQKYGITSQAVYLIINNKRRQKATMGARGIDGKYAKPTGYQL